MPVLTLEQVSLAFGHLPLFENANLRVEAGERLALIGRNGTGKSTLLKVVAGELPPDAGTVWQAPGVTVARLSQDAGELGIGTVRDEVAAGLRPGGDPWEVAHHVDVVMSRLGLPADRPVQELSGGWRRRVVLGRALVSQPDVLLLDEPTNHLDIDAIRWLEEHLRDFSGALLFVTHDRVFLRRLATRIVELDRGALTSWPGSYEEYRRKKAEALETEARDLERLDKKLAEEEAWLRRGIKARRTRNEGRVRALMALRAERAAYRAQSGTVRMALERGDASGRAVFELESVSKAYSGIPVIRGFSTRIVRGDRVGLIGPNGSGKTTLLRLLVGEIEPEEGEVRRGARLEIAYFDQQREQLDPEKTVADSVSDADTVTVNGQPRHVLGYLADFLFPRERTRSPVKSLSGGERNRLLLARLFARPANVLVMDEPTNDLDVETLELLEELIAGFDGTVLLVTHDREFLDNVVTSTFAFEGEGRVVENVGGYEDYVRQTSGGGRSEDRPLQGHEAGAIGGGRSTPTSGGGRSKDRPLQGRETTNAGAGRQNSVDVGAGLQTGPHRRSTTPATRRKKTYNEEREYEALPARIEALEDEQRRLQEESASPDFYKSGAGHIAAVLARIDEIHTALEDALARWLALEEIGK